MKMTTRKEQLYNTMLRFEKVFFPESLKNRLSDTETEAGSLTTDLTKESRAKVRRRLILKQTRSA
ncbi:MAG: hypothetical protein ACE5JC_04520 [Candidatus Zixiibacteriota bacterium]